MPRAKSKKKPAKVSQFDEIKRLLTDKEWRISHLYKITDKDGRKVTFSPNHAQAEIAKALKANKRLLILKSRQLGATTFVEIFFLDEVLFTMNVHAISLMHAREHAIDAFDRKVRYAWENFDPRLREALGWKVDTERANQLKFDFSEGSSSSYTVSTSGRSGTYRYVHVSEFGTLCAERPQQAKELITGTFPAVPEDGTIIIESTANGETGYFADMWRDAEQGKNGFYPLFLNWRFDVAEIAKATPIPLSGLPVEFHELKKRHNLSDQELSYYYSKFLLLNRDWTLLLQEYPTTPEEAFQGSGEKFFDTKAIDEQLDVAVDGTVAGNAFVYSPPKEGRHYVIGSDPSEGVGSDHSAAVVIEIDGPKPRVVLDFASNTIGAEEFGLYLAEIGRLYNNAFIAVERNSIGAAVIASLRQNYEEDLLFKEADATRTTERSTPKIGFRTTSSSKPRIMTLLNDALKDHGIVIPSKRLLRELRQCPSSELMRTGLKDVTNHYDLAMATCIGWYALLKEAKELFSSINQTQQVTYQAPRPFDPFSAI